MGEQNNPDALRAEVARVRAELDAVRAEKDRLASLVRTAERLNLDAPQIVPPGHFYSPIPLLADVRKSDERIFGAHPRTLPALDLDEPGQLRLLDELKAYYPELPFPAQRTPPRRFFFENPNFSYTDAIFLYSMIRHVRPKRVLEVGSGYSSCATLDTNELFFGNRIQCTFVEPYPQLLLSLIRPEDVRTIEIIGQTLQSMDPARFAELEAGDILFIDSSHVAKVGSDVNYLVFEVLPVLRPGVYVHIHDIFYPFEYLRDWVYAGRAWTEAYLLRAFLEFNRSFRIVLFASFLHQFHGELMAGGMPLSLKNTGGSIWLRREE